MNKIGKLAIGLACSSVLLFGADTYIGDNTKVPDISMKNTGLITPLTNSLNNQAVA